VKLLSAAPSPYARKVRIALHEKNIPFELVTEVPWNAGATAPLYNPLGKIPVLILEDGESYYESRFIIEYLELAYPLPALYPRERQQLLAAKRLEVLADGACDAFVLVFMERQRPAEHRSVPWLARQQAKIKAAVDEIAKRIDPSADYAIGNAFGLGDIAVGTLLQYFDLRYPELDWRRHGHLLALAERLWDRPSFQRTAPKAQTVVGAV
jgi:glutathione S-transferase